METFGSVLERCRGVGPGFDFLRISMAVGVVAFHSHYVVTGNSPFASPGGAGRYFWMPDYAVLVMFFAISGFLTAGSGLRHSLKHFLVNRAMRMAPALAVEIVLSALILGPLFTNLPLTEYFGDPRTYRYFSNLVGIVNYYLPGVFVGNPAPEVNSSVWTVPFEYACYFLMAGIAYCGLLRRRAAILGLACLLVGVGLALVVAGAAAPDQALQSADAPQLALGKIFGSAPFLGRGSRLPVGFLLGIAAYLYREKIPYDWRLFWACAALCAALGAIGPAAWLSQPLLNATACPAVVYMTVFLGLTKIPLPQFLTRSDYSYGIYLYGFPVQQAVRALVPIDDGLLQLALSIGPVLLFAAFSWHMIEKPIFKSRRIYFFIARERFAPRAAVGVAAGQGAPV